MKIKGKNIIVTGAASGIGYELVLVLMKYDCRIIAVDSNCDAISIKDPKLDIFNCDLSNKDNIDGLFNYAIKRLGSIDIFIANAGFAYYEKIETPDWDHIAKIFYVNTVSPIYSAELLKKYSEGRPYNFATTASAMAHFPLPGYALYSGTKAAIKGFADAYRYELDKEQRFQVIFPIATKTNFFTEAGGSPVPFPCQEASLVARRIIKGIENNSNSIYPSRVYSLVTMLNRVLPFIMPLELRIENSRFQKWLKQKLHA